MKGHQGFLKRNNQSSFLFYKIHFRRYRNQSRVKQNKLRYVFICSSFRRAAVLWILSCPQEHCHCWALTTPDTKAQGQLALPSAWTQTRLWPSLQCCRFSNLKASLELKMSLSPSHSLDVCFCLPKPWIQLWSFQSRAVMLFPQFLCQVTQNTPRLFGAPCSASGALSQRLFMQHHSKLWAMLKWLIVYGTYHHVSFLEQPEQNA